MLTRDSTEPADPGWSHHWRKRWSHNWRKSGPIWRNSYQVVPSRWRATHQPDQQSQATRDTPSGFVGSSDLSGVGRVWLIDHEPPVGLEPERVTRSSLL